MNAKKHLLILMLLGHTITLPANVSTKETALLTIKKNLYQNYKWFRNKLFGKDWLAKYAHKERSASKNPITSPTRAAESFKTAVTHAINKQPLMRKFLNNDAHNFLFGASSSSYQYEGGLDEHNASAAFYKAKDLPIAGDAIDFWNRYEGDIKQIKEELGINSFRISIAWDRIAPALNKYDTIAIAQYQKITQTLKDNGIEPIVVLHHYTIPTWFAEIGGFEKEENNHYFVSFAKIMYAALRKNVTYWSTFNAIEGYAFKGYYTLDGPPGKKKSQLLTQHVMANMLTAHVNIYQAIKGKDGLYDRGKAQDPTIPLPLIGIQKNIVLLDPYQESYIWVRGLTRPICFAGTELQNRGFFNFFTTGTFSIPLFITKPNNPLARQSIDWIGLNIYSNMNMRFTQKMKENNPDFMTENINYRDYPEGIYRAARIINDNIARPLNIPIFITENGIATKNDIAGNEKRTRFFRRALYTIRKLIEENYTIIGYTPWASHDNYEWPSEDQPNPYDRPYGIFTVDFNSPDLTRSLKTGAHYYRDFIKKYFEKINN